MRYGINPILEEEANEIIKKSLAGTKSHSAKKDILTPWKEKDRRRREVYASQGYVDPAVRSGQYHRAANKTRPHLNSNERGRMKPVPIDPTKGSGGSSIYRMLERD